MQKKHNNHRLQMITFFMITSVHLLNQQRGEYDCNLKYLISKKQIFLEFFETSC